MRSLLRAFTVCVLSFVATACADLNIYSDEELDTLSLQAYQEASKEHQEITSGKDYEMIQRIAGKIALASEENFPWQAKLLKADDTVNAFCLPNGRIAVYTGLLKVATTEDEVAAVMGHEVAHATKRHGGKRMTQGTLANGVMAAVDAGLGMTDWSPEMKGYTMAALGAGSNVLVILPFSRDHESEADVEGLRFAIRAGYDPNAAPALWDKMAKLDSGGTPGWLSTHPKSEDRAKALREMIPQLVEQEKGWQPKQKAAPAAAPATTPAPAAKPPAAAPAKAAPANNAKK